MDRFKVSEPPKAQKGRYYYELMSEYRSLKRMVETYTRAGKPLPTRLKAWLPKLKSLEISLKRMGLI